MLRGLPPRVIRYDQWQHLVFVRLVRRHALADRPDELERPWAVYDVLQLEPPVFVDGRRAQWHLRQEVAGNLELRLPPVQHKVAAVEAHA